MDLQTLIYLFVGASSRCTSGSQFGPRLAQQKTSTLPVVGFTVANGMATAADWMSAASFISLAGIVSLLGRDGAAY